MSKKPHVETTLTTPDYLSRVICVDIAERAGLEFTQFEEEAERSSVHFRVENALLFRISTVNWGVNLNTLGSPGSWSRTAANLIEDYFYEGWYESDDAGWLRRADISQCDRNRLIDAINQTDDATLKKFYAVNSTKDGFTFVTGGGDEYRAWYESLKKVISERVQIKAITARPYTVHVGDTKRRIVGQQGLATLQVSECAITENGVKLLAMNWPDGDKIPTADDVQITNRFTGRKLVLERDHPKGDKSARSRIMVAPGKSTNITLLELTGNDWTFSIKDIE